jgi:hypothetical protein
MALSADAVEKRVAVQTNGATLKCIFSPISKTVYKLQITRSSAAESKKQALIISSLNIHNK